MDIGDSHLEYSANHAPTEWLGPMPPWQPDAFNQGSDNPKPMLVIKGDGAHLFDDWFWVEPQERSDLLAGVCPRNCRGECGHDRWPRDFFEHYAARGRRKSRHRRALRNLTTFWRSLRF